MTFLGRVLGAEQRDGLETPSKAFLDLFGDSTKSGQSVSVEGSMGLVGVYAAVSKIAGSVGSLPLMVYRRLDEGRERADNHRAWKLLHDQPNPDIAADEFWELVMTHLLLWGNGFIAKFRDSLGIVNELRPVRPNRVKVGNANGTPFYILDDKPQRYGPEDILHIRGMGTDGLVGLSPIQTAREMIASGQSLEEFTGQFWANSANPGGVLTHPNTLTKEAAERLQADWKTRRAGVKNAGMVAVLEEGMKWESVGLPLRDAQFIETTQFSLTQIALLFGLHPSMLGGTKGDSMTYANSETEAIDFVRWSLRRWLVRIEGSLLRDPSIFTQGQRFFPEFLIEGFLRGDTKSRYEAYSVALGGPGTPFMDVGEIRDRENLNPNDSLIPPDPQGGQSSANGN